MTGSTFPAMTLTVGLWFSDSLPPIDITNSFSLRFLVLFLPQSQALSHYKGTKHAKKLKSLDVPKCKQKSSAVMRENRKEPEKIFSPSAPPSTTERKGRRLTVYVCIHCCISSYISG